MKVLGSLVSKKKKKTYHFNHRAPHSWGVFFFGRSRVKKYFEVKNWSKFQHYKDRHPPWIKLHRELFDDHEFYCLPDASKLQLMLIWLLASQKDNHIEYDEKWLKNKLGIKGTMNLKPLFDKGFISLSSGYLADCEHDASPEAEAEAEAYNKEAEIDRAKKSLEILAYLNLKTKKQFLPKKTSIGFINARLLEGHTVDEFKTVVDNMVTKWIDDPKMNQYLRPSTLFAHTKFEGYLNATPLHVVSDADQKEREETKKLREELGLR